MVKQEDPRTLFFYHYVRGGADFIYMTPPYFLIIAGFLKNYWVLKAHFTVPRAIRGT